MKYSSTMGSVMIAIEGRDKQGDCIAAFRLKKKYSLDEMFSIITSICTNNRMTMQWINNQSCSGNSIYHSRGRVKFNCDICFVKINDKWYIYTGTIDMSNGNERYHQVKDIYSIIYGIESPDLMYK